MPELNGMERVVARAYQTLLPKIYSSSTAEIIKEYADLVNVPVVELKSKRRTRNRTIARAGIFRLLSDRGLTLEEIGIEFGGRDHSTVLYSKNKFLHLFAGAKDLLPKAELGQLIADNPFDELDKFVLGYFRGNVSARKFCDIVAGNFRPRFSENGKSLDSKAE